MPVTSPVLCDFLGDNFALARMGQGLNDKLTLTPPLLYVEGLHPAKGQVLVMQTNDLPSSSHVECLYLCVGRKPPKACSRWMGEVIHVSGSNANVVSVFNEVQKVFTNITMWEQRLSDLAAEGSLADMVQASLAIFENRMTIVDYDLNMLVSCAPEKDGTMTVIDGDDGGKPVPSDIMALFASHRKGSLSAHNLYLVESSSVGRCLCMNVFSNETYAGSCSLLEGERRPFRQSDHELFPVFVQFVQRKILSTNRQLGSTSTSLKSVFEQLLSSFPVSARAIQRAIELKELSLGRKGLDSCKWFCLVVNSVNGSKVLSERFLCETFEQASPMATTLPFDNSLVVFCQLDEGEQRNEVIDKIMQPILKDLCLEAGVSRTFEDVFRARDYYMQACCAIETGIDRGEEDICHYFESNVLDYMLTNSCGDFDLEMIVDPELIRLAQRSRQGVDYIETLRVYLDNECSATKTARNLFIHRSTLAARLDRIANYVDFETPAQRLYLRMCLALDIFALLA